MAKVLIVDDDVVLGRFLQISLGRSGHDVRLAHNRDQAYVIAPDFRPDVLIVDWMPTNHVDGVDLAQVLRKGLPDLRVVLITGYPCEAAERKAATAKIAPILVKPVGLADLTGAIEEATRGNV